MIDKEIYRYSNVELLDIIRNGINESKIKKATSEFNSRDLSNLQKTEIESEYLTFINLKRKRETEPLTTEEYLTFLFLPFITTKPRWRKDHFSEYELERFKKYGFQKKHQQASKIIQYGYILWIILIAFGYVFFKKLK